MSSKKVITRFPPSPTGYFHIGSARTALFNYLYARHHGGEMVFRLEDTDKAREVQGSVESLVEGMHLLGMDYDNERIYRQSERTDRYVEELKRLIEDGNAYEAEDAKDGSGKVIRFKNPNKEITFTDEVRGEITFDTTELADFVIARTLDDPLYHLTVVVDDNDMGITHVIRGDDHISNTPRQILLLEALGYARPVYAHLPLILNDDRSKMSKRKNTVDLREYFANGYLPEAIVNFLALLGWNPGDDREYFTLEELVKEFDLDKVQKAGAIFNVDKLKSINKYHIGTLSEAEFEAQTRTFLPESISGLDGFNEAKWSKIQPILRERISIFGEVKEMAENGELRYFFDDPELDAEVLVWKKSTREDAARHIEYVIDTLKKITNNFDANTVKEALWEYASEEGRGDVLWPMRYALSGQQKSPDPFQLAEILGKEETRARLETAHALLLST